MIRLIVRRLCARHPERVFTQEGTTSHGVMGNEDTMELGEKGLPDYLAPLGYRTAVIGKTHNRKSQDDMEAMGVDPHTSLVRFAVSGGFEPYEWHEGLYPDPILPPNQGYTNYLKEQGYKEDNPWDRRANSGIDQEGNLHSGWKLRSSRYPAAVREEQSETAFTTRRAVDFMNETVDQPWCLHLSYIKPHWPLIAPAPYHNMYQPSDVKPVVNGPGSCAHPVVDAFRQQEYSLSYANEEIRNVVIPVYMGLVKQIDDHLGKLFQFMESRGLMENTMIVLTADHGDYLGDHGLGEKDLFHNQSVKVPFIVVDPGSDADVTRNTSRNDLVEAVDLVPTFVEYAGGKACRERIEGRSLLPILRASGAPENWRDFAFSEIDYSERGPRELLNIEPYRCRAIMLANHEWKYIHYLGFPSQLFNLQEDPQELNDLGQSPDTESIRQQMLEALFQWKCSLKSRVGLDYDYLLGQGPKRNEAYGIIIGRW